MIVPMSIAITRVNEVETYLLILKLPVSNDGENFTSIQPVKVKNTADVEEWTNSLSSALSSALSEAACAWGTPADLRRKLMMPEATRLAASNL